MAKFSEVFQLDKTQGELDFVDIDLDRDTALYLDPYALTTREDEWSTHCHALISSFFESVLAAVRQNNRARGAKLMQHLGEPEETMLGVSKTGNKGRGIGPIQAQELFDALAQSHAAKTGLLEDLSDFALFVPQIGRDKISDMTTNIVRGALIEYTANLCKLYSVPLHRVSSGFFWDMRTAEWMQTYTLLPVYSDKKILLVPKHAVRYEVGVDHTVFRSKFVLEFLQAEHLRADDSLVTTFRNKKGVVTRKVVHKKTVDQEYPRDKDFLAEFSKNHPQVIDDYRESLRLHSSKIPNLSSDNISEPTLARHLAEKLRGISPGAKAANAYHNLMIGVISFIFFPNLIYPQKEVDINDGRKRIDITYTNGKESGLFYRMSLDQSVTANIVHVECKNYTDDIANAEFDQLTGRFNTSRGRFGILLYRSADKPKAVIQRAQDALKAGLGLVLPLDDAWILDALSLIENRQRPLIDARLDAAYRTVAA